LENIENNEIPENQASDEERVQRIIQEMNSGEERGPGVPQMPAPAQQAYQYEPAPPMSTGMPQQRGGMMMHPSMVYQQEPAPAPEQAPAPKKNVWAHISDAFKLPLVVSVVFFLLSLPLVDVYLSRYAHWAFSSGGQLSTAGLVLKSVAAGAVLGVYDTLDNLLSRFF
jgi:hypothetical protein